MNKTVPMEEFLNKEGSLTYRVNGVSMLPFLRPGKDIFTVKKKGPERMKRGDVALCRLNAEKYALHRLIKFRPDDYVILGDNCVTKEYGITDDDVIGVMTGYVRNDKEHAVNDA